MVTLKGMEKIRPQVIRKRTVRDLYPSLNDEQLREAEENLGRYVELVLRIYERIRHDGAANATLKNLTGPANGAGMGSERSTTHNNPFPNS
jgi:hypothetical protein